jgi:hypothetical protein
VQLGQVVDEVPKRDATKTRWGPLESNLENTERSKACEVELEDWLLESLNHRYVIPEDFSI